MTALLSKKIMQMTKAHYKLQVGSYLNDIFDIGGATYSLGKYITDCYWNYASLVRTQSSKTDELIRKVESFSSKNGRKPAFYLDPSTQPVNFFEILQNAGYTEEDHETWMAHNVIEDLEKIDDNPTIQLELVKTEEQMTVFTELFNTGFGMTTNTYGDSLISAFKNPSAEVEVLHYIAKLNGKECGIASLYSSGKIGGIYNVATVPEFRRKGVGTALNKKVVSESLARNHELLILQTEANGDAYRIYERMGFRPEFLASIFLKD